MKLLRSKQAILRGSAARGGFIESLILYAVLFIASDLLRPKPKVEGQKPAGLGDFSFPTATEERFVPLLWGTVQITGPNVVWWGDLRQDAITEKVKTGLFSSDIIVKGYQYRVGIQSALCRGTVNSLERVWIGDDEVFVGTVVPGGTFTINKPDLFGGEDLGNGGVVGTLRLHGGSNTQAVSDYLKDFQKIGSNNRTPAYRGTCYVAPDTDPVYVGNSTSIKPWKYELKRIPNGLSLTGGKEVVNGADANLMNALYEILTDTDWGLAISASKIDVASLVAAAETLYDEGNGFSYLLDSPIEAAELIAIIEEQADGILFFNQIESKFQLRLARADYVIGSIPSLDDGNILEFNSFARGSWEDTTNYVRSQYNDRGKEYTGTFGLAIDSANIRIQEGAIITATKSYPGCKDGDLARDLAWRDLRALAFPLAKASIVVDATNYALQPGQPVRLTNADLGITDVAFRIIRIDYGELEDNRIALELIEDVFYYLEGSFGSSIDSGWEPPLDELAPFSTSQTLVFETPRAFNARDPFAISPADHRIFASARKLGVEVTFKALTKLDGASESAYREQAEGVRFLRIGELTSALSTAGADPITALNITASPDAQDKLREVFEDNPSLATLGADLSQLIMVGNEMMLVQNATDDGATVDLETVYRGVCDTTRESHAAGADVWLLTGGGFVGGVTMGPFTQGASIDVKLLPRSASDSVDLASATEEEVDMLKRSRRPYPPGRLTVGASSSWNSTVALEQLGGAAESTGFAVSWLRRDYRTGDGGDEIAALGVDAASLFADFPAANLTRYDVRLYDDPDGSPDLLISYVDLDATSQDQLRIAILQATGGALPTRMRIEIDVDHTDNGETLATRYTLRHDFDVTSLLSGQFEFGALDASDVSASYTATTAGTFAFSLSTSFTSGDVEYRLNGGSWTALITSGNTSGSIVGVAISDTIEIRHTSTDSSVIKQLDMNAAGAGTDAFAILFT